MGNLTKKHIKEAIDKKYFIIEAELTKTMKSRLIPVNKEARWILKYYLGLFENPVLRRKCQLKGENVLPYDTMSHIITKERLNLTLDELRNYCTSKSLSIGVPDFLEAMTLGHDTEKYEVRFQNYLKQVKTKMAQAQDWLKYWEKEELLTEKQKKTSFGAL